MKKRETATQQDDPSAIDNRLRPLLTADGEQYDVLLQEVIEKHADPLIRKIIGAKLQVSFNDQHDPSDSDAVADLSQEAIVKLIAYLRMSRENHTDYNIKAFDEFVATVAFNVYNKYLRGKYPQRHKLKRQLYYLLRSRETLALWKESYDWIAGLLQWKRVRQAQNHSSALDELTEDEWNFVKSKLNGQAIARVPLDQMLVGLFEWIDHPLEFDLLVKTVSHLLKIKDQPNQNVFGDDNDAKAGNALVVESSELTRVYLHGVLTRLWIEIKDLPIKQRWALLCNLRDKQGVGLINELPPCGIASPQEIARALEITLEELGQLWKQFPLRDAEIGKRLGIDSQKVVNLRKSARERLARRMGNLIG
jgi:DNA-directed RNA polymerase specialized sigma24 family protein